MIAGVAQLVEQLSCKQQVGGSNPFTSSIFCVTVHDQIKAVFIKVRYSSGQRGQTVNLLVFTFEGSNPSLTTIYRLRE